MSPNLVTIAAFASPLEAHLARNCLAEAGIESFLMGEEAVAMAWMFSNAVGGVKLQVEAADEVKALAVLASFDEGEDLPTLQPVDGIKPAGAIQAPVPAETVDEEEADPPRSSRERAADRVCMVAILALVLIWLPSLGMELSQRKGPPVGMGLFFLVLQVWMFWQLLRIYLSDEPLRTKYLLRAGLAALISIPYVLLIGMSFNAMLSR
jgi:hypothetical protein